VDSRLVFWVDVPVGIGAPAVAARVLPKSRDEHPGPRPDVLGAGLLATSVGLLAPALVQGPAWGWVFPRTLGALAPALSLIGLAALAAPSRNHPAPVIQAALLRSPALREASSASLVYYLGSRRSGSTASSSSPASGTAPPYAPGWRSHPAR